MSTTGRSTVVAVGCGLILLMASPAQAATTTIRVSVATNEGQADGPSHTPSVSDSGRFIAFESWSEDLVTDDVNDVSDIFVRDRKTGTMERVSVSSTGHEAVGGSRYPAISGNGRYVAFVSYAKNLVPSDTNDRPDVFVHDRHTELTERVSVSSAGVEAKGPDEAVARPAISADGRFVAFQSLAGNLVPGDHGRTMDIFVRDRHSDTTERVTVAACCPAISDDGEFVGFVSNATNLVSGDTNGHADVFVYERATQETTRVSVRSNGIQANAFCSEPDLSGDGRFITFASEATNLVGGDRNHSSDVFVHDLQTKQTKRASIGSNGSEGDGFSMVPAISASGRFVAFASGSTNLVAGDTNKRVDVFVRDLRDKTTRRVSISATGKQATGFNYGGGSWSPSLTATGKWVAFSSEASNLVADDTNDAYDIFMRGPLNRAP